MTKDRRAKSVAREYQAAQGGTYPLVRRVTSGGAVRCQRCSNLTLNTNGRCHLHQTEPSGDSGATAPVLSSLPPSAVVDSGISQPGRVNWDPQDLRDSVRDYRNPSTSAEERAYILSEWKRQRIPNQFAAMLRAGELEKVARLNDGELETLISSGGTECAPADLRADDIFDIGDEQYVLVTSVDLEYPAGPVWDVMTMDGKKTRTSMSWEDADEPLVVYHLTPRRE